MPKKRKAEEIRKYLPNLCKKDVLDIIIWHYDREKPFVKDLIKLRTALYGQTETRTIYKKERNTRENLEM